jgi:hypothetical protein
MVKVKSKATITVADGVGGMTKVEDRRFVQGEWPRFEFTMPTRKRKKSLRRWVKENPLTIILIVLALGLIVGLVADRLIR